MALLPGCEMMHGSDRWFVAARAWVKDREGNPLQIEEIVLASCLTEDGVEVGSTMHYPMHLDFNGFAETSLHPIDIEYEEGLYTQEVRWVFGLHYEGRYYCDTLYHAPLLRIEDQSKRYRTTEFRITIDSL